MELELLHLRRDSNTKASQLVQMEETLKETKGLLDKKSEIGMQQLFSVRLKSNVLLGDQELSKP